MSAAFSHGSYSTTFSSSRNNDSAVDGKGVREYLGNEMSLGDMSSFEGVEREWGAWKRVGKVNTIESCFCALLGYFEINP